MENQGKQRRRIMLVPFPFQGHITPMLHLATILHSKGFSITIPHVKFNSPDPSTQPDFDFVCISDILPKGHKDADMLIFINAINDSCQAPLQELLTSITKSQEPPNHVAAIIYDTLINFPEDVAKKLKLPNLPLRSSSATYLNTVLTVPRLKAEGYLPLQDSMLQELVPGLSPLRFKDLPLVHTGNLEDTLKLLPITSNIGNSSAIIWNTIDYLEHPSLSKVQQHYKVPVFSVGPLHKISPALSASLLEEDTSCLAWLDHQAPRSVIYVSLGSLVTMDEKELAETAWGLAHSRQPFLWVIRSDSVRDSEWIELFPKDIAKEIGERGRIVKWTPQKEVLAHPAVGGFLSHCGWNSTLESISEGVPMLCKPSFIDQRVNARYLSHVWKLALELEDVLERGNIESTIRRLMLEKEGDEIRQRMIDTKEKVKACMCKGGASYNSLNDLADFILSFKWPK